MWWEGKTPSPPADVTGWRDWKGDADLRACPKQTDDRGRTRTAGSRRRWPTCPTSPPTSTTRRACRSTRIIFGGRTRDREPLIRAITDPAEGVYDGLTLGAEATFAAEGVEGKLRYDPMSMRPFMSYPEGAYAAHWLKIIGAAAEKPIFAHVNWFQRDPRTATSCWPGLPRQPARAALAHAAQERRGHRPPDAGRHHPDDEELNLDGVDITPADLDTILSIDIERWRQEMALREEHLAQFDGLPEEIWEAHRRIEAALEQVAD